MKLHSVQITLHNINQNQSMFITFSMCNVDYTILYLTFHYIFSIHLQPHYWHCIFPDTTTLLSLDFIYIQVNFSLISLCLPALPACLIPWCHLVTLVLPCLYIVVVYFIQYFLNINSNVYHCMLWSMWNAVQLPFCFTHI